jgi:hypothetical protein
MNRYSAWAWISVCLALAACGGVEVSSGSNDVYPGRDAAAELDGAAQLDAGAAGDATDDARVDAAGNTVAPAGAVKDEVAAKDGANALATTATSWSYRVDALPSEHVAFELTFAPTTAKVTASVDRWSGTTPVSIGSTADGSGLRVLAVRDAGATRTFWMRVASVGALTSASLKVTRTSFAEGIKCAADCAKLLQLPLPNDKAVDGYAVTAAPARYQFGRRDMVMFIRQVAAEMAKTGHSAIEVADISQWNGETPGTDVGALRHLSHQRGKDVDLSLYGLDKKSVWRSYCTTETTSGGTICKTGTATNFDAYTNAAFFGRFYASDRVTYMFLDQVLIAEVKPQAAQVIKDGHVSATYAPYYADGKHLQHWPNHGNHVHVRVSEDTSPTKSLLVEPAFIGP